MKIAGALLFIVSIFLASKCGTIWANAVTIHQQNAAILFGIATLITFFIGLFLIRR